MCVQRRRGILLCCCIFLLRLGLLNAFSNLFNCPPWKKHRSKAYRLPVAEKYYMPLLSTYKPKSREARNCLIAIVPVHGARRELDVYFQDSEQSVHKFQTKQNKGKVTVVAPGFAMETCPANKWGSGGHRDDKSLTFADYSDGKASDQGFMTSFEALDRTVQWVEENFENLKLLVVTGFSAGGQMVQKWSILSPIGENGVLNNVNLRIVVGGPGTILYLDDQRPARECSTMDVPDRCHKCERFYRVGDGPDAAEACKGNPYGYDSDISGFSSRVKEEYQPLREYLLKTIPERPFTSTYQSVIRTRYRTKDVRFLLGKNDVKNCKVGTCLGTCPMMAMGTCRLQRGLNFLSYLRHLYPGYEPKWGIYEAGHRHYEAWGGAHWQYWVFEELFVESRSSALSMWVPKSSTQCGVDRNRGAQTLFREPEYCWDRPTCSMKCENEPTCTGFTYEDKEQKCWLLHDISINKCNEKSGWLTDYMAQKGSDGVIPYKTVKPPEGALDAADESVFGFSLYGASAADGVDGATSGGTSLPLPLLLAVLVAAAAAAGVAVVACNGRQRRGKRYPRGVAVAGAGASASEEEGRLLRSEAPPEAEEERQPMLS
eukprot:TRINITY_DN3309_c0_g2_i1.p1 TRINITY_DN3309_c0_g2~~TRINITY_DN3309_c0_g2_i1.p1  ORF type:complete len:613 (-),score=103.23 TRINITY_DN3309_c0_g2_i1:213-2012(-)